MNNETQEQKPLTKHIQTAITAIEKEIFRLNHKVVKLEERAHGAELEAGLLRDEIAGLKEQISKLKGE